EAAQSYVSRYFADRQEDPSHGSITISGERYILVRAASMSVEFFDLVRSLYDDKGPEEARSVASNLLFDTAHAIGKADARTFREKMGVVDPIERLSAGPVHFAFSGWAFVDILPESRPSPDEDYYLAYEHPFSFESHAWLAQGRDSSAPVCVMNAGYSSGWCEESFGLPLVAVETECLAAGDARCRFIMAPPSRIEEHLARASTPSGSEMPRRSSAIRVPEFFQRKRLEDELRQSHESLESRVLERTADLEESNARLRAEIEERRAAEEALRASEDRFARAFQMSPVPIAISTLDEGRYLDVNEAFTRLMERPREALVGRTAHEIGFWEGVEDRERIISVLRGGGLSQAELDVVNAAGSRRKVLLSAELVELQGQRCILSILHDVTDRRREEETLRLAQKMESLGVLAGGVAHDFNNLLAVMLGHTSLALANLPAASPVRDHVEKAVEAAERAAGLTRQMLAYSGRGHFQIRPTDLNQLVRDNAGLLGAAVPKQVQLVAQIDEASPHVAADPSQIQQILMNLTLNAAEAIGQRPGTVTIATRKREVGPADRQVTQPMGEPLPPGLYAELTVHDDGVGIDDATRSRIFEPFFSTKATGHGLGLAATQGIVRGHRGGLRVDSATGKGTTFTVLLRATPQAPAAPPGSVAEATRGLVLVVDDEEGVRTMIAAVLDSVSI
ncbi:MAG TPA: ATP-binding protein, partial [Vicinamibacteria bacterium]